MKTKNLIILLGVGGVLLYFMKPKVSDVTGLGGAYAKAKPRRIL